MREGCYWKRGSVTKILIIEMEVPEIIVPYRHRNILVCSNVAEIATEKAISNC